MSAKRQGRGGAARDRPAEEHIWLLARRADGGRRSGPLRADSSGAADAAGGKTPRGVVWLSDWEGAEDLACAGYRSLAHSPEVVTAVDRIAALMGAMPIHLMRNGENADVREINGLSRIVDISPNAIQTRAMFLRWIVRTLYLDGDGNAVVLPRTENGYLRELRPIPAMYATFNPSSLWGYSVAINGQPHEPASLLHFTLNPGRFYPWLGEGPRVILRDVANNLKQAAATEKGFMESKWKPSVIVKVDALTKEFAGSDGRRKLLDAYVTNSEAGQPWIIPAQQFDVRTVKPLTLNDLALRDTVELDKRAVASILGVPPFVLGVGEFNKNAWNNFVSTVLMPLADTIAQELTKKLLYSSDLYFRFNPRALLDYDITELVKAGAEMVDRMAMRRNEWRDWLGLPYDPEMDELLALENYIPANRLGDQSKLTGGETDA